MLVKPTVHDLRVNDPVLVKSLSDSDFGCGVLTEISGDLGWVTFAYPKSVQAALQTYGDFSTPSGIERDAKLDAIVAIEPLGVELSQQLERHQELYLWPQSAPFRVALVRSDGPIPETEERVDVWRMVLITGDDWQPVARVSVNPKLLFSLGAFSAGLISESPQAPAMRLQSQAMT